VISNSARLASVVATGWPTSPICIVEAHARPTMNQAPAKAASQPPNIAVARLPEPTSSRPPTTVVTPGNTSSQPRAAVQNHCWSGV
jgi:hypothetical protein